MLTPCSRLVNGCICQVSLSFCPSKLQPCVCFFFLIILMCVCVFLPLRNREIRRIKNSMKAGNSLAFLSQDINELEHSRQVQLPRVSVVMPLKGFGEHNVHNWRSQVCVSLLLAVFCLLPTLLVIFTCVDYLSLWWTVGIPICFRKYSRPCISCCFPSIIYVSGAGHVSTYLSVGTFSTQTFFCLQVCTVLTSKLCSLLCAGSY